jgi:hypothetical protein
MTSYRIIFAFIVFILSLTSIMTALSSYGQHKGNRQDKPIKLGQLCDKLRPDSIARIKLGAIRISWQEMPFRWK